MLTNLVLLGRSFHPPPEKFGKHSFISTAIPTVDTNLSRKQSLTFKENDNTFEFVKHVLTETSVIFSTKCTKRYKLNLLVISIFSYL